MVVLSAGLIVFFALAVVLTRWRGESPGAVRFMVVGAAASAAMLVVSLVGGAR